MTKEPSTMLTLPLKRIARAPAALLIPTLLLLSATARADGFCELYADLKTEFMLKQDADSSGTIDGAEARAGALLGDLDKAVIEKRLGQNGPLTSDVYLYVIKTGEIPPSRLKVLQMIAIAKLRGYAQLFNLTPEALRANVRYLYCAGPSLSEE